MLCRLLVSFFVCAVILETADDSMRLPVDLLDVILSVFQFKLRSPNFPTFPECPF